jgi:membrane-associated phospholipid phosphatase
MPGALLGAGIPLVWLVCWAVDARWFYRRYRPFTEPVNCLHWIACRTGKHDEQCYRRHDDGTGLDHAEAVMFAAVFGLLGPLAVLIPLLFWAVTGGDHQTLEEAQAKIARLEADDKKWRREHG